MKKEDLLELIQQGLTIREAALKSGAPLTSLRRWAKKFDILSLFKPHKRINSYEERSEKECTKCKIIKPQLDFYSRPDGRMASWCKSCSNDNRNKRRAPRVLKTKEERSRAISAGRKAWCAANPDKHNWRNKDRFKSVPCEKLKEFLQSKSLVFIEEYQPNVGGRHFSIDIAFPDKMIAIEVNGNQHYEKDGRLKPYYQERHDILESNGWTVYEIHFSACFDFEKWSAIIGEILNSKIKVDFDYLKYIPRQKNKVFCECGKKIGKSSKRCSDCRKKSQDLSIERRAELVSLYTSLSMAEIARRFCISESSIKRWCIKLGLCEPLKERKKKSGDQHDAHLRVCPKCLKIKNPDTFLCRRCGSKMPAKEELLSIVFDIPMTHVAKKYNVTDNCIKKWCQKYGIVLEKRHGYWTKRASGMSHEEALQEKQEKKSQKEIFKEMVNQIIKLKQEGKTAEEIAALVGREVSTIYRIVKQNTTGRV